MIFDFTANRVIFMVGILLLFIITTVLVNFIESWIAVLLVALAFVLMINFLMKRVAQSAYQNINTLLFVHADAEGYLNRIETLYRRGSKKRRQVYAVKFQNLIMAYVFAGDYGKAKEGIERYKAEFATELENNASMRLSQTMIETLIYVFDYDADMFETTFSALRHEVEQLEPETRKQIEESPYSIYYMIATLREMLASESIDVDALKKEFEEMNEFLKTCILHVLTKTGKLSLFDEPERQDTDDEETAASAFRRAPGNTLFFKDSAKIY